MWNIALEAKYKIKLEHGKVDMSFTYKSFTSELSHHQFVVAKSCFSIFHLSTWIHNKTKIPIIHASSDLWSLQDSDLDTFKKIDAPRSMTMLLKSFLASTSNYNENTNAKPLARTPNEKAQIEFQCTIKMN